MNRKLLSVVIVLLGVTLQLALILPNVQAATHTDISCAQAYAMIYSTNYPNLVVMDVRSASDFNTEHILGAISVPVTISDYSALYAWISSAEGQSHKNHEIIVHCRSGVRSHASSNILDANGFTGVYDLSVGISSTNLLLGAWKTAGYSTIHVTATIDIKPETCNLGSEGKWITCIIELPTPNSVNDIVISTIKVCGSVSAASKPTEIGDYDGDAIPDLMIKFDRTAVQGLLNVGENRLWVTFSLNNQKVCGGWDVIRVAN